MKKTHLFFALLVLVLLIPASGVFGQDEGAPVVWPDLGGREITIAVENEYCPYSLIRNGEAVGWDYDTFYAICELLNCTPVFEQVAWDGMLIAMSAGQYDVAADGITYTMERDETVDFGQLYQSYDEALLVRENESRFSTVEELIALGDFAVGTQLGTTNEQTAHNLFGIDNVRSLETFGAAVEALRNDDVDAVVVDRPAAQGLAAQGGLKVLPESLSGIQGLAFVYPPGSDLIAPINAAMSALEASGKWDEIFATWFPDDGSDVCSSS